MHCVLRAGRIECIDQEVALRDANQQFATYVRVVEAGASFVITRRRKPVARLVPIEPGTHQALVRHPPRPGWNAAATDDEGVPAARLLLSRRQFPDQRHRRRPEWPAAVASRSA